MPIELRRAYLNEIRERYQKATKRQKTLILNEFCINCRYTRKYAIRVLNGTVEPRVRKPGPKPQYETVRSLLVDLWGGLGKMCSKKLKYALPLWLPYYKQATNEQKTLLLKMAPATMDRYIKPFRTRSNARGLSTTVPVLKHSIPIKLLDSEVREPGFIESDTVSHCGDSPAGSFASSLTMTDLCSSWTENRATWTKEAVVVLEQVKNIERVLPFSLRGFASDNGNEFLNELLHDYLTKRMFPVEFVRRRPYRKNDSAHVEQKNFTHVRSLFGYERFDDPSLIPLMNEIYRLYWNPLWNYFTPVMKLVSKTRVGSRIVKKYDKPKTPCQRLLDSDKTPRQLKRHLTKQLRAKNPFFLRRELEKKLKTFFKVVEELKQRKHSNAA